jgi:hypothetical protein
MNAYPAVRDPGSIGHLFRTIRSTDAPEKITADYLASIGFRRQSDAKLLELLLFLGFINSNKSPSAEWKSLQGVTDDQFMAILSHAMEASYCKVFQNFNPESWMPDSLGFMPASTGKVLLVNRLDGKALMSFFHEETGVSDTEIAYMVLTLQVLSDLAGFQKSSAPARDMHSNKPLVSVTPDNRIKPALETARPNLPVNLSPETGNPQGKVSLNITIPSEAMDAELTDLIKKLLKKAF